MSEGQAHALLKNNDKAVRLIEQFTDGDSVYLVTKYANEGSMLEYQERNAIKTFSEAQTKSVIR